VRRALTRECPLPSTHKPAGHGGVPFSLPANPFSKTRSEKEFIDTRKPAYTPTKKNRGPGAESMEAFYVQ
jgi:hypothetical protein